MPHVHPYSPHPLPNATAKARVYSQSTIRWIEATPRVHPQPGVTIAYYRYIALDFRGLLASFYLPRFLRRFASMLACVSSYNRHAFSLAFIQDLVHYYTSLHGLKRYITLYESI